MGIMGRSRLPRRKVLGSTTLARLGHGSTFMRRATQGLRVRLGLTKAFTSRRYVGARSVKSTPKKSYHRTMYGMVSRKRW